MDIHAFSDRSLKDLVVSAAERLRPTASQTHGSPSLVSLALIALKDRIAQDSHRKELEDAIIAPMVLRAKDPSKRLFCMGEAAWLIRKIAPKQSEDVNGLYQLLETHPIPPDVPVSMQNCLSALALLRCLYSYRGDIRASWYQNCLTRCEEIVRSAFSSEADLPLPFLISILRSHAKLSGPLAHRFMNLLEPFARQRLATDPGDRLTLEDTIDCLQTCIIWNEMQQGGAICYRRALPWILLRVNQSLDVMTARQLTLCMVDICSPQWSEIKSRLLDRVVRMVPRMDSFETTAMMNCLTRNENLLNDVAALGVMRQLIDQANKMVQSMGAKDLYGCIRAVVRSGLPERAIASFMASCVQNIAPKVVSMDLGLTVLCATTIGCSGFRTTVTAEVMRGLAEKVRSNISTVTYQQAHELVRAFAQFGVRNQATEEVMVALAEKVRSNISTVTYQQAYELVKAFGTFGARNQAKEEVMVALIEKLRPEIPTVTYQQAFELVRALGQFGFRSPIIEGVMRALVDRITSRGGGTLSQEQLVDCIEALGQFDKRNGPIWAGDDSIEKMAVALTKEVVKLQDFSQSPDLVLRCIKAVSKFNFLWTGLDARKSVNTLRGFLEIHAETMPLNMVIDAIGTLTHPGGPSMGVVHPLWTDWMQLDNDLLLAMIPLLRRLISLDLSAMTASEVSMCINRLSLFHHKVVEDAMKVLAQRLDACVEEMTATDIWKCVLGFGQSRYRGPLFVAIMERIASRLVGLVDEFDLDKLGYCISGFGQFDVSCLSINAAIERLSERLAGWDLMPNAALEWSIVWSVYGLGKFGLRSRATEAAMTRLMTYLSEKCSLPSSEQISLDKLIQLVIGLSQFGLKNEVTLNAMTGLARQLYPMIDNLNMGAGKVALLTSSLGQFTYRNSDTERAMTKLAEVVNDFFGCMSLGQQVACISGIGQFGFRSASTELAMRRLALSVEHHAENITPKQFFDCVSGFSRFGFKDHCNIRAAMTSLVDRVPSLRLEELSNDQITRCINGLRQFGFQNEALDAAVDRLTAEIASRQSPVQSSCSSSSSGTGITAAFQDASTDEETTVLGRSSRKQISRGPDDPDGPQIKKERGD